MINYAWNFFISNFIKTVIIKELNLDNFKSKSKKYDTKSRFAKQLHVAKIIQRVNKVIDKKID